MRASRVAAAAALASLITATVSGPGRAHFVRRYGLPPERRGTSLPSDRAVEAIELPGPDGSTLRGLVLSAPGAEGTAVALHGWGSSALDLLPLGRDLHRQGLNVLLVDAGGHGRSDAVTFTSMPRFAEDLQAALIWVRADPQLGTGRLVLVGHSVGAGACLLAARDAAPVDGLVLLASMADPRTVMRRMLQSAHVPAALVPVALRVVEHVIGRRFRDFAPCRVIADLDVPVLIVHGDADQTVPVSEAHLLAAAAQHAELIVVPGAGHNELGALQVVSQGVRRMLAALPPG